MNEVTLRINTRILERIVWIIIVLILLIALVWTNSGGIKDKAGDVTGKITEKVADVKAGSNEEPKETIKTTTTPKTETQTDTTTNTPQTTDNSDDTTNDEPADLGIVDGEIKLSGVTFLFKVTGEDSGKVDQINYKILNGEEDFEPHLELYIYGEDEDKETNYDDGINPGKTSLKGEVFSDNDASIGITLIGLDTVRTYELILKNEDGDTLDTYKQDMKASELKLAR